MNFHKPFVGILTFLLPIVLFAQVTLIQNEPSPHGGSSYSTAVKGDYIICAGSANTVLYRKCLGGYVLVWSGPPSSDVAISNENFAFSRAQDSNPLGAVYVGSVTNPNGPLTQVVANINTFDYASGDALAFAGNDLAVRTNQGVKVFVAPSYITVTTLVVPNMSGRFTLDADESGGYKEIVVPTDFGVSIFRKGATWSPDPTQIFNTPDAPYSKDVALNDGVFCVSSLNSSGVATQVNVYRRVGAAWVFSENFNLNQGANGEFAGFDHIAIDQDQIFLSDYSDINGNYFGVTRVFRFAGTSWAEVLPSPLIDENSSGSVLYFSSVGMDADDGVLAITDVPTASTYFYSIPPNTMGGPAIVGCGTLNALSLTNGTMSCTDVPNATSYRFQFSTPCGYTRNISSTTSIVPLNFAQGKLEACMSYQVKAQAQVNGVYGNYGPECTFTTAGCQLPALQLTPPTCNSTVPLSQIFAANRVLGGYQYQFEITGIGGTQTAGYSRIVVPAAQTFPVTNGYIQTSPTNTTGNFTSPPFLVPCGSYNVRVRRVQGCSVQCGSFSDWGPTCMITIAGNCLTSEPAGFPITALAKFSLFPNPTNDENLIISIVDIGADVNRLSVEIFDGLGRSVYVQNVATEGMSNVQTTLSIGGLSVGVYEVALRIGDDRFVERLIRE